MTRELRNIENSFKLADSRHCEACQIEVINLLMFWQGEAN